MDKKSALVFSSSFLLCCPLIFGTHLSGIKQANGRGEVASVLPVSPCFWKILFKSPEAVMPFLKLKENLDRRQNCGLGCLQQGEAPSGDAELPSALFSGSVMLNSLPLISLEPP